MDCSRRNFLTGLAAVAAAVTLDPRVIVPEGRRLPSKDERWKLVFDRDADGQVRYFVNDIAIPAEVLDPHVQVGDWVVITAGPDSEIRLGLDGGLPQEVTVSVDFSFLEKGNGINLYSIAVSHPRKHCHQQRPARSVLDIVAKDAHLRVVDGPGPWLGIEQRLEITG